MLGRVRGGEPGDRELQAYADSLVPEDPAAWTNALMDLGAMVCRPARPDCPACPLRAWCSSADVGVEARGRAARSAAGGPRFEGTARWLRGRILDAAREAPADGWATFDRPLGDHARDAVLATVGVLASEGLLERHASDRTLARLPR